MIRRRATGAVIGAGTIAAGVIVAAASFGVHRGSAPALSQPSKSARMVCSPSGQEDIAGVLGTTPTAPVTAAWVDHLYACTYMYAEGHMLVSVKELENAAATTAYFTSVQAGLGSGSEVAGIGEDAFQGSGGSVLVRKDFNVLLVDVSGLPARIGSPPVDRATAALDVATAVMGCWTGA